MAMKTLTYDDSEWQLVPKEPTPKILEAMRSSGWLIGCYRTMLAVAPQPPEVEPAPINMILHCPACGKQHIDAPDWMNDPQSGAVRLSNEAEQSAHAVSHGAAQQQNDEPVSLLLRQGGVASGRHAEHPLQDMRLPPEAVRGDAQSLHPLQEEPSSGGLLLGQEDRQPQAYVQTVHQAPDGGLGGPESRDSSSWSAAPRQGIACEASVRTNAGGVPSTLGSGWSAVRDMRQSRAAVAPERRPLTGSLPHDGQDQGSTLLPLQHDAGLREGRSGAPAQRDQVPSEVPLRAPSHRSHLCRPEDGGCGHIWRPADVPTNGVAEIKTKGKADSPKVEPAKCASVCMAAGGGLEDDYCVVIGGRCANKPASELMDEQCDELAHILLNIGGACPGDAQWGRLKHSGHRIRAVIAAGRKKRGAK